jgi:UDP-N-acetylglucosamine acyltransferase
MAISKLAVVSETAHVAPDVEIGPFCYVGPDVTLGAGNLLHPGVTVVGHTRVGARNVFFPNVCIGTPPQDISYRDEPTETIIGDDNVFRENVTLHRGTTKEMRVTRLGSRCFLMACSHVGHDCDVGDNVILGNNVLVGGHVHIESGVIMNGGAAIHPFTTIGRLAYIGGLTRVVQDVPPFMILEGHPSRIRNINSVGMRRAGIAEDTIEWMAKAYRRIYRRGRPQAQVLEEMDHETEWPAEVRAVCQFLRATSSGKHGRYRESLRGKKPTA